ncbi:ATP-binding cassette domain-containing protein [Pseudomonas aeruginosa]|nr:ATP-binding cassette domain-containing protein [Pseudomonas aeruginosa]
MSTDSAYAVELKGLTFKRGSRAIFDNIDVRIPRGKVTGIMGPSGCGKTTLLRLIASQLRPSKGGGLGQRAEPAAAFARRPVRHAQAVRRAVPERGAVHRSRRLRERRISLRVHTQLPEEMIRDIVLMKLQAVGPRGAVELMPDELSGGMKRRVALARAIALDPQILLYDEPFVGQDPIAMGVLVRLIRLLNDALGITSIVVSHDLAETASIADYIYIVGDGRVLGHGTPDVLTETDDPRIRQFVKGIPDGPVPFHYPARDYRADLLGER